MTYRERHRGTSAHALAGMAALPDALASDAGDGIRTGASRLPVQSQTWLPEVQPITLDQRLVGGPCEISGDFRCHLTWPFFPFSPHPPCSSSRDFSAVSGSLTRDRPVSQIEVSKPHVGTAPQSEIKACPFCGKMPRTFNYNGTLQAQCASLHTECAGADVIAPISMWNRRAITTEKTKPFVYKADETES